MDIKKTPSAVYMPHPLSATEGMRTIYDSFDGLATIEEYLDRYKIEFRNRPVMVVLNNTIISPPRYPHIVPRPGDRLTIRARVQGGDSDPMRTILTIAVLVAAGPIAAQLGVAGALGVSASVATSIVALGGMLLVNALVPIEEPSQLEAPKTAYSLNGTSNRARLHEPLPLVYGVHRLYPDLGAKVFTDFRGEDQWLYMILNCGLSDLDFNVSDIKIGDSLLTSFGDYELEISGATGALDLFPGNIDTIAGGDLTANLDSWVSQTTSIDTVEIDVEIQGYLYRIDRGGILLIEARIDMEYKSTSSSTWLPLFDGASTVVFRNDSRDPFRWGRSLRVPKDQYDVRIRMSSTAYQVIERAEYDVDGDISNYIEVLNPVPADSPPSTVSSLSWHQLKSYQPDTADYTGQKRIALALRASGKLTGTPDSISILAKSKIPAWTGSAWVTQVTSNPAWQFYHFSKGMLDTNGARIYGAGLLDSQIDIEEIKVWGAYCASAGLTCDVVFDSKDSTQNILRVIARCGRGVPTWAGGKLGIIFDEPNKPITAQFGMSNIARDSFTVEYISGNLPDGIEATFNNASKDYLQDTVRVTLPGVINPVNYAKVSLKGVTLESVAGREANLIASEQIYRKRIISFETDIEGLGINRGEVALLSHDLTQWGYSGRLVSGNMTSLVLDRTVPFSLGETHYIGVRAPDGTFEIVEVTYQTGPAASLLLTNPLTFSADADSINDPMDYIWFFEPEITPGKKVKVTDIQPLSERRVRIICTDEVPAYYSYEFNGYNYNNFTPSSGAPNISNLQVSDTLKLAGSGLKLRIGVSWDHTTPYGGAIIRARRTGSVYKEVGRTTESSYEFDWNERGKIEVEVLIHSPDGKVSDTSSASLIYNIQGKTALPANVIFFNALQNGSSVVFRWHQVGDVDLSGYEIRYSAQGTGDWDSSVPLTEATKGTNVTSADISDGDWDFYIKAIDTSGNYSATAASASLTYISNYDQILTRAVHLAWEGTLTNCVLHYTKKIVPISQTLASANGWNTFANFNDNPVATFSYEDTEIDVGFDSNLRVYAESTAEFGFGETGILTPTLEFDYRKDAAFYDGYEPWSIGLADFRYGKFRLSGDTSNGIYYLSSLDIIVDLLERVEKHRDVNIGISGTIINFTSPFHLLPLPTITVQGNSDASVTYDSLTTTSIKVYLWAGGSASTGFVDLTLLGV